MTDKQLNVMKDEILTEMRQQFSSVQKQINELDNRLSSQISEVDNRLSNEIKDLSNRMFRNKLELSQLIKDNAEINGREHQMMIDTLEKRYQDLDNRVKELRGDIDTVYTFNKYEHEKYNKALNIQTAG